MVTDAMFAILAVLVGILLAMVVKLNRILVLLRSDLTKGDKTLADQESKIRSLSAVVFGQLSHPNGIEPLISVLKDKDKQLQQAAAETLVRFGLPAIMPLASAVARNEVPSSVAVDVLMRCVKSEEDLLLALDGGGRCTAISKAVLKHSAVGDKVLKDIAEQGPMDVLTLLVAMDSVQGTTAQTTAQRRLQEEADRRREEEDRREAETPSCSDDYEYESGTCDCRWR